ncbi:Hypothetical_protein [Hexamita inflata]|uniref:Hypothetical_protein n=1 Tax=Hexamita inflata TaxID=28002 RepID=A0AA86UX44_9EUKA|nr:Hypothetical protein HINF_LOCUS55711 [Hexamita inflata]
MNKNKVWKQIFAIIITIVAIAIASLTIIAVTDLFTLISVQSNQIFTPQQITMRLQSDYQSLQKLHYKYFDSILNIRYLKPISFINSAIQPAIYFVSESQYKSFYKNNVYTVTSPMSNTPLYVILNVSVQSKIDCYQNNLFNVQQLTCWLQPGYDSLNTNIKPYLIYSPVVIGIFLFIILCVTKCTLCSNKNQSQEQNDGFQGEPSQLSKTKLLIADEGQDKKDNKKELKKLEQPKILTLQTKKLKPINDII